VATAPPELLAHREWIGQILPVGLVVSPTVLVGQGVFVNHQRSIEVQARLVELAGEAGDLAIEPARFFAEVFGWSADLLATPPDSLTVALPEYEDHLRTTYAVAAPTGAPAGGAGLPRPEQSRGQSGADAWQLLIQVVAEADLDAKPSSESGWRASPHARMERLLRETGVPIGLLFNGTSLRLVYAPKHESSGHLTFQFKYLVRTQGRPMAGALAALLDVERVTDIGPVEGRLATVLRESRKSQNDVSTALAGQVLEALWELVRGFQRANQDSKGELLDTAMREAPTEVYGGLLTTLMRLVFVLYAEDRDLMPAGDVYQRHYSLAGLFEKLREDAARYPDTMGARYGAWAQLLALFRLIHDGGRHGNVRFTARHGRLFDPDAYPFLEGRPHGTRRSKGQRIVPPRISDDVVYRVLSNLLVLDGERLSYRALDVEQIGSVYEAMMGFALEQAAGPSLAVSPKHIVINLDELLAQKGSERAKWLQAQAELKLTLKGKSDALSSATTVEEVVAAIGKKASRYTPAVLPVGALYLQPTEERRRSGSHYTPRSLTQPIVATTFRPIFERLGDRATPEQILDLKVCDPAMGSGAFLVEACRLLSEKLVRAWEIHKSTPRIPEDEDVHAYARRLVAERCLYGVDKNVFAVDLAKLSLWLATLAREHPFTFLDHSLRHGDSLVGLSREQIACFNWEVERQLPLLRPFIDARVTEAQRLREQIQGLASSDDVPRKELLLRDAEDALADVRLIGDVVISSFFERAKPKDRKVLRTAYAGQVEQWLRSDDGTRDVRRADLQVRQIDLRTNPNPISPFHWEIEFPEVFTRDNGGFDVFVGNPPFLGGTRISTVLGMVHFDYLRDLYPPAGHLCDLIAYFFRRSHAMLRTGGAFGLIATNTIAQGDTRSGGLEPICEANSTIYHAHRRLKWPGQAVVVVSAIHVVKGRYQGDKTLDDVRVSRITAYLLTHGGNSTPARLEGRNELFSAGSKIYGQGFVFDDGDPGANPLATMRALIGSEPQSASRIKPYIGGDELNTSPELAFRRYVIDLNDIPDEAGLSAVPLLAQLVRNRVKPDRDRLGPNPNNVPLKRRWWAYQAHRPTLYAALMKMPRAIAISQTTKYLSFAFVPSDWVFSQKLNVFLFADWASLAVLQSRVHEVWALTFGSTMKDDPVYTPSDCFETFPFPPGYQSSPELESIGREYYEYRAKLMLDLNEGLTKVYNRFHDPHETDPRVARLRHLHDAMDRAVLDAYGWTDIRPVCELVSEDDGAENDAPPHSARCRYRWQDGCRDEVLARLLGLNADMVLTQRARPDDRARAPDASKRTKIQKQIPLLD
jgi:hypothetical protein